jgi:hypothetical protein
LIHAGFTADEEIAQNSRFEREWRNRHIANDMMSYLSDHGSSVQFLTFLPTREDVEHIATADGNGHIWSRYFYAKGTITMSARKGQQVIKTVAVPVRREDVYNSDRFCLWGDGERLAWNIDTYM